MTDCGSHLLYSNHFQIDKYIYCVESRGRETDMLVNWMKANANETVKFHDYTQYGTENNSTRLSQPCLFSLFYVECVCKWMSLLYFDLGGGGLVFLFCMLSSSLLPQTECEKKKNWESKREYQASKDYSPEMFLMNANFTEEDSQSRSTMASVTDLKKWCIT